MADETVEGGEIEIVIDGGNGTTSETTPAADTPVEAAESLRQQIRESEAATATARAAQADAEARARAAEERTRQITQRASESERQVEVAQYDTVVSSLNAAKADAARLSDEKAKALADGDYQKVAQLDIDTAKVGARIVNLEDGKTAIEEKRKVEAAQPREQPREQQPRQPSEFEAQEVYLAQQNPVNAKWIRDHRDRFFRDSDFQRKAIAASQAALNLEGLDINSSAYLDYVETKLGIRQAKEKEQPQQREQPRQQQHPQQRQQNQNRQPAAAPSTSLPQGNGTMASARVTLTPEEIAHARVTLTPDIIGKNSDGTPRDPVKVYAARKLELMREGRLFGNN